MKTARLAVVVFPGIIALVVVTIIVHELAHLITAIIVGIPIVAFTWFDPRTISPSITFGLTDNRLGIAVVHYAGGLLMGALWLVVCFYLFISKKYAERNLTWWSVGLFITMLAFWQIGQGVLEGSLHQLYILGAGKIGSISFIVQCLFIILGFLVYLRVTHLWRDLVLKRPKVGD